MASGIHLSREWDLNLGESVLTSSGQHFTLGEF
uniref:Uncharacterized protein n=1 Tax=Arundo donax TaxID=35708 RepID=A0A0A9AHE4_ARUDO